MNENEIKIIEAAYNEFMEHGYSQATTLNIASNANVNESTIFRKFKSKKNLFHLAIEHCAQKTLEIDFDILEYQDDWSLDIERVIRYLMKINLNFTSSFRLLIKRKLVKDEFLNHIHDMIEKQKNLMKNYLIGIQKRNNLIDPNFTILIEILNSSIFCDSFDLQAISESATYNSLLEQKIKYYTEFTISKLQNGRKLNA